jgi:hypothetical protein
MTQLKSWFCVLIAFVFGIAAQATSTNIDIISSGKSGFLANINANFQAFGRHVTCAGGSDGYIRIFTEVKFANYKWISCENHAFDGQESDCIYNLKSGAYMLIINEFASDTLKFEITEPAMPQIENIAIQSGIEGKYLQVTAKENTNTINFGNFQTGMACSGDWLKIEKKPSTLRFTNDKGCTWLSDGNIWKSKHFTKNPSDKKLKLRLITSPEPAKFPFKTSNQQHGVELCSDTLPIFGLEPESFKGYWEIISGNAVIQNKFSKNSSIFLGTPDPVFVRRSSTLDNFFHYTYFIVTRKKPTIEAVAENHVSCYGGNNGSFEIKPIGNKEDVEITWSYSQENISTKAANLEAGKYWVSVNYQSGCAAKLNFEIKQPDSLVLSYEIYSEPSNCFAYNGIYYLKACGGVKPYSFLNYAMNGDTVSIKDTVKNVNFRSYKAVVTDKNNCSAKKDIEFSKANFFYNRPKILGEVDVEYNPLEAVKYVLPLNGIVSCTWMVENGDFVKISDTLILVKWMAGLGKIKANILTRCGYTEESELEVNIDRDDNQAFIIKDLPLRIEGFGKASSLIVTDGQSNKTIYQSSNYQNDWFATDDKGNFLEDGEYHVFYYPDANKTENKLHHVIYLENGKPGIGQHIHLAKLSGQ